MPRSTASVSNFRPFFGVLAAIAIPTLVILYSYASMGIPLKFWGIIDNLIFILVFYLLFNAALSLGTALRIIFSFSLIFVTSTYFLSNTIYYRFFHTWGQADNVRLVDNIPLIWQSILVLGKPQDLLVYFVVPVILWQFSLGFVLNLKHRTARYAAFLLVFLFAAEHVAASKNLIYSNNNPFFFVIRQKISQLRLTKKEITAVEFNNTLSRFQLTNKTLEKNAGGDTYPFEKVPLANAAPLPFALPPNTNVVLVLIESMRAFECGAYGANPSYTPNLDKLAKDGVLFKNFYAVGAQTIRGEFAVHSGFNPNAAGGAIYSVKPDISIVTLPMVLKKKGYKTFWISGCPPHITKKFKFLSRHGIDEFYNDIPNATRYGLGPSDEDIFKYAFGILSKQKEPFFAEIMTLTNHFPFDGTMPTKHLTPPAEGDEMYLKYLQTYYYTDYAIGKFVEKVKKSSMAKNTLFIFTGDHGMWLYPKNLDSMILRQEIYFRSPFILWSPSLLKPSVITTLGSQVDIPPTVLDLLSVRSRNSFLGASLFRKDTDDRFVFMIQDGRWNLRYNNEYALDVGPEIFANHPPYNLLGYCHNIKDHDMAHFYFSTDIDLMQSKDLTTIRHLSLDRSKTLKCFSETALEAYGQAIYQDRVSKP